MGMSYTGFGAPVTTKNLQANADLNLGNYDLIATDVKGDTAEFDEFVGGVGNFTSGLISGGLDVGGILHAENTLQADGNIILKGSINNVNIADNGEITTAQGVNGAGFNGAKITSTTFNGAPITANTFNGAPITANTFNGATITSTKFNGATIDTSGNVTGVKGTFSGAVTGSTVNGASITSTKFNNVVIKTGVLTVTPTTGTFSIPSHVETNSDIIYHSSLVVLPYKPGVSYSGSVKFHNNYSGTGNIYYWNSTQNQGSYQAITAGSDYTLTFSNIKFLIVATNRLGQEMLMYNFTIS